MASPGAVQLNAEITSAYLTPQAENTRLNNTPLDPPFNLDNVFNKMVGVPRSSGCRLCVSRRVKVRIPVVQDINKYPNESNSVTNANQVVQNVKLMVNHVLDMTRASSLLLGNLIEVRDVQLGLLVPRRTTKAQPVLASLYL